MNGSVLYAFCSAMPLNEKSAGRAKGDFNFFGNVRPASVVRIRLETEHPHGGVVRRYNTGNI